MFGELSGPRLRDEIREDDGARALGPFDRSFTSTSAGAPRMRGTAQPIRLSVLGSNRQTFDMSTMKVEVSPGRALVSACRRAVASTPPSIITASTSGPVGSVTSTRASRRWSSGPCASALVGSLMGSVAKIGVGLQGGLVR